MRRLAKVTHRSTKIGSWQILSAIPQSTFVPEYMVTTAFTLDGYKIVRNLGVVRGIVVRSRSVFGTIGAGLQTLVGGNITLLERASAKRPGRTPLN